MSTPASAAGELRPADMPEDLADRLAERFHPPAGWAWGRFQAPGGHSLRYGRALPEGEARGTVVLLPGFTEFGEKYFETSRDLLAAGFAVWQLDWRGHGASERYYPDLPQRTGAQGHQKDAADLIAFIREVVPESPRPRVLIAHSMGGLNAVMAVKQAPDIADRLVLSAPMLALAEQGYPEWVMTAVARGLTWLGQGHRYVPGAGDWTRARLEAPLDEPPVTTTDPQRGRLHDRWMQARPELRLGGASFAWLNAALKGTHRVQEAGYVEAIGLPVLMGTAGDDHFVDTARLAELCRRMPDCTRRHFPQAHHELFLERDKVRAPWMAAVTAFIASEPLPAAN